MKKNLPKWVHELEEKIASNQIEKESGIKIFEGKVPILISAPHSVEQLRNGKKKLSEPRTAAIVQYLTEHTNCYGAFKTMNFSDDANYDEKNYYKDALIDLVKSESIKLLIDLHIMNNQREHHIDIGTGLGRNIQYRNELVRVLQNNFVKHNILKVRVDYQFQAVYEHTVSATIARTCQIPCFQLEINWNLLDENSGTFQFFEILQALEESILQYNKIL